MREKQPGVKVGEIKKALAHNREIASNPKEGYGKDEGEWRYHDSNLENMAEDFIFALPEDFIKKEFASFSKREFTSFSWGSAFKKYIEKTLLRENTREKPKLTAVEFGGPGSRLFEGFTPQFFSRTVGICLEDIRSTEVRKRDEARHHMVIESDVMEVQNDNLLYRIKNKLASNKTDLIISRMRGPLFNIDRNGAILDRIIRNWYVFLNENGLIFAEFSPGFEKDINEIVEKWAKVIKKRFPEIDIQVYEDVLRLHKKLGSPETLPTAAELGLK